MSDIPEIKQFMSYFISILLGILIHLVKKSLDQNFEIKSKVTEMSVKVEMILEDRNLVHAHDRDIAVLKSEVYGQSKKHTLGSKS